MIDYDEKPESDEDASSDSSFDCRSFFHCEDGVKREGDPNGSLHFYVFALSWNYCHLW